MAIDWGVAVGTVRSTGDVREATYVVTAGAVNHAYVSDGDALTMATLGLSAVLGYYTTPALDSWSSPTKCYIVAWDPVAGLLKVFGGAAANTGLAELNNGHDVGAGTSFYLTVHGKGTVAGPTNLT